MYKESAIGSCESASWRTETTCVARTSCSPTTTTTAADVSAIMSSPPIATAPAPVRTAPPTANVEQLRALLRTTLRVTVTDGRVFIGTFAGTDKQLNVLLVNTDEYRLGPDPADGGAGSEELDGRYVGQVMIPWRLVVRVEAREAQNARMRTYRESDEESMYI
ncbi:hypothetical protein C8Q80DRAFT_109607 [Daedaleopsis nitida]|nr:hypothetical protein C8Q80DRAFT_109607 [Daedaleopsis nitida]